MSSHRCITDGPAAWADLIWVFRGRLEAAAKCLHLVLLQELGDLVGSKCCVKPIKSFGSFGSKTSQLV